MVAERILAAERPIRPGDGEIREAALVVTDLRGFTRFANGHTPAEVMRLLADYQKRIAAPIFANGGTIDKFLGDGVMAHFGAATPSETYAADAFRAVDALVGLSEGWAAEHGLKIGIACASGELIFGAVGDEERLEYTVIGDPVNLAAKLEKHTKKAQVQALATRETHELALRQGYAPARSASALAGETVEGWSAPIDLVAIDDSSPPSRFPRPLPRRERRPAWSPQ